MNVLSLEKAVKGRRYLVKEILENGPYRRILDFGMLPETVIEVVRVAPLGDPLQFKVRGFYLSLRKKEARYILVEVAE